MRWLRHPLALVAALVLVIGAGGLLYDTLSDDPSGEAADGGGQVYWANVYGNKISSAWLDGRGGGDLDTTGATALNKPAGVALDPARNRIWWANTDASVISYADLDGGGAGDLSVTGTSVNGPVGLDVDSAAGRIYWANWAGNTISYANLDGSGGNTVNAGDASVSGPHGVTVDPSRTRIYWANYNNGTISYANLDGSGGANLDVSGASINSPNGVALDPTTGRIWWANRGANEISYANADGSGGGGDLDTTGATVSQPYGVALDRPAGRIWWVNLADNSVSHANLDGSGGGDLDTGTATVNGPSLPALLQPPVGRGAPTITGSPVAGSRLECSFGTWAGDEFPSLLYQAPRGFNYAWTRDGAVIAGAYGNSLFVDRPARYGCSVTASNHAGSATQTSAAVTVASPLALGGVRLNKKKGTAKLSVTLATAGSLRLSGEWVATQNREVGSAGKVKLLVKPKGDPKRKLNSKGKASVKVTVQFKPIGAGPSLESKKIKLKKRLP